MTQPPYGSPPPDGPPPPYGSPQPYGSGRSPSYPMVGGTSGAAVGALVCGIAGLVTCLLPIGIAAVILGNRALDQIAASGGAQTGRQLAVAGRALGWVAIGLLIAGLLVLLIVLIVAGIATP